MKDLLLQLLIIAYASVGVIYFIAYLPTIRDLYNKKPSANILSYVLWTGATGIALLYSIFILPDIYQMVNRGIKSFY